MTFQWHTACKAFISKGSKWPSDPWQAQPVFLTPHTHGTRNTATRQEENKTMHVIPPILSSFSTQLTPTWKSNIHCKEFEYDQTLHQTYPKQKAAKQIGFSWCLCSVGPVGRSSGQSLSTPKKILDSLPSRKLSTSLFLWQIYSLLRSPLYARPVYTRQGARTWCLQFAVWALDESFSLENPSCNIDSPFINAG